VRRTKIVCTIGPASSRPETLDRLVAAGMDVARVPLAHGSLDEALAPVKDADGGAGKSFAQSAPFRPRRQAPSRGLEKGF